MTARRAPAPDLNLALPEERQAEIRRRLERDGRVLAIDLAKDFGISEDTVRRDLRDMAADGLCRRVYGGALRMSEAGTTIDERVETDRPAKRELASAASVLFRAKQTVFIDTGSTNLCLAEALPLDLDLTVVTNTPGIAAILQRRGFDDLVVIGGKLDRETGGCFGARAMRDVADFKPDLAFMGICALAESGVSVFDAEEAAFKRQVVQNSAAVAVLVTTAKLSTTAAFGFARLDDITTIVVEGDAPERLLAPLGISDRILRAAAPAKGKTR